jgi:hypothetical protein
MNDLTCPHCHTTVPRGARVCTGCQAEATYGPEPVWIGACIFPAIFLGVLTGKIAPDDWGGLGWIVGLVVFGGLAALIAHFCRNRVSFKRIYRTQR